MPTTPDENDLSMDELREIAGYAAECAKRALPISEQEMPGDSWPRDAIESAFAFAAGGKRTNALRTRYERAHGPAYRAALDASTPAAVDAAHAASQVGAAASLHPLARANQVKHLLGSAAHAARAADIDAGDHFGVGAENIE